MTTGTNTGTDVEQEFDAIALAFLEERAQHKGDTLQRYITRYPFYTRELTLLAFETAASDGHEPAAATPSPALAERLRTGALAALLPGSEAPLKSLLSRGRTHAGLAPRAFARRLDISVDVLAMLEERHIAAETIFPTFLERIAQVLGTTASAVQAYLTRSPLNATRGVAYHAPRGHEPARKLSFVEAIAGSNLMTAAQKTRWLAHASDDNPSDNRATAE